MPPRLVRDQALKTGQVAHDIDKATGCCVNPYCPGHPVNRRWRFDTTWGWVRAKREVPVLLWLAAFVVALLVVIGLASEFGGWVGWVFFGACLGTWAGFGLRDWLKSRRRPSPRAD